MKNLLIGLIVLLSIGFIFSSFKSDTKNDDCNHNKDEMVVVMRFEMKVKPEKVSLLKESFDKCKVEVLAKEPGCLDYSLFQSYNDSTLFCITEAWKTNEDHNLHMKLDHTKKHLEETKGIRDPSFKSETSYMYWVCPDVNGK